MSKKKTPLQIKKENEAARITALTAVLDRAKANERASAVSGKKRKDSGSLAKYLTVSADHPLAVRRPEDFVAKSYNLGRQVLAFVDHVFGQYPAPLFMYRPMLTAVGQELVFGEQVVGEVARSNAYVERNWFLTVVQGRSLAHETKGVLTKREAHWFLKAPHANSVQKNIFWAKCAGAGVPLDGCQFLVERLADETLEQAGDRIPDILAFYAQYFGSMTNYTRHELTDFVRAAIENPGFSFKGRTLGSMLKLCRDWHRTANSGYVREYISWPQAFKTWEHREKGTYVRAVELTNNRALADEGQKQKHCVYTYTFYCARGTSRIVSFRWLKGPDGYEATIVNRLTVEVLPQEGLIVQVRGALNRSATQEELKVMKLWAQVVGLQFET